MAKSGGDPAAKNLRKHLKRLEDQLAVAAKAEAKLLRKLEKARWRRQRIEAFLDEVRTTAEMDRNPAQTAPATPPPGPAKPAPAKPAPAPRPAPKKSSAASSRKPRT